ncbi:hypothetical protein L596_021215 [Steinernema carpocapsae]|uniref:Neurotransmitter-gated ion-channel ligand-binding domain-containing protein n=1 Tax=Steinernema carpocapsae TaxID=34508 RepID=A0A4U5MVY1_STECR|nr:hypothetical protein L596_021215 [Steinernema carpocapsae]
MNTGLPAVFTRHPCADYDILKELLGCCRVRATSSISVSVLGTRAREGVNGATPLYLTVFSTFGLTMGAIFLLIFFISSMNANQGVGETSHQRLILDLLKARGQEKVKPKRAVLEPVVVTYSMELYQMIELNERQQYVLLSAWVVERWYDELLYWEPEKYDNLTQLKVPHNFVWLPDTTLYNTLVMKDEDQRRMLNVKLSTDPIRKRSHVEFLYPAIFKFSCQLYLQYFPFDSQVCVMIFGSWTSDNQDIDYIPHDTGLGTSNYLSNEGWSLMGTRAKRKEVKYVCCPVNYTLLEYTLYLRRRPLFYLVNLVIPTFIITLIAITGFFTTSSTTGVRQEKISLCITTLLSMSILMLMVSDQMPSTSTFIPLISWFYMCAIVIISVGALAASFVISVQKFGRLGDRLPPRWVKITKMFSYISFTRLPFHLLPQSMLDKEHERLVRLQRENEKDPNKNKGSFVYNFAKYFFIGGNEEDVTEYYANGDLSTITPKYSSRTETDHYPLIDENGLTPQDAVMRKLNSASVVNNNDITQKSVSPNIRKAIYNAVDQKKSDEKKTRHLAQIEYDWLATVIERCTLIIFVFVFLTVSLGINIVGCIHWLNSHVPEDGSLTE